MPFFVKIKRGIRAMISAGYFRLGKTAFAIFRRRNSQTVGENLRLDLVTEL